MDRNEYNCVNTVQHHFFPRDTGTMGRGSTTTGAERSSEMVSGAGSEFGRHLRTGGAMRKLLGFLVCGMVLMCVCILMSGCATTGSMQATPLKATVGEGVDLSRFRVATVVSFGVAEGSKIAPSIGVKFAEDIAVRLEHDFGPLFAEIRRGSPLGQEDELIVTGTITTYRPGSAFARAMLIGLGSASFEADFVLKDAKDGKVLLSAPIDKLWAWGGALGASKGIQEMEAESAAASAATVAKAKGWVPPSPGTGTKEKK